MCGLCLKNVLCSLNDRTWGILIPIPILKFKKISFNFNVIDIIKITIIIFIMQILLLWSTHHYNCETCQGYLVQEKESCWPRAAKAWDRWKCCSQKYFGHYSILMSVIWSKYCGHSDGEPYSRFPCCIFSHF